MQRISILRCCFHRLVRHNVPRECSAIVALNRNYSKVWTELETQRRKFVEYLKILLPVTDKEGEEIFHAVPALRIDDQMANIEANINFMLSNHITPESIIKNPFLLVMKLEFIEEKLEIIETMGPMDVNDFIPLLELPLSQLENVAAQTIAEYDTLPEGNRIYFFCNRLNVDVQLMAKLFVKNDFMFTFPFNALQKKLRILLDYNVDSSQVMQCLYIFGLAEQRIIERVEQFISMGIPNIQLSTFKFTEENFQKALSTMKKTKTEENVSSPPIVYTEKTKILDEIQDMLPCSMKEGALIYYSQMDHWDEMDVKRHNIALLKDNQVDDRSIIDNPFLLSMNSDDIKTRLSILRRMKPRNIVDFVPLLRIPTETLSEIAGRSKAEHKNKIYYFSEKLQIQPWMVANAFADYADIFFYQFDLLTSKLDLFLSYNMNAQDILSDLPAFERSVASLTHKLNLLSVNKNEPIRTWMLCTDGHRFNRMVEERNEKMKALDKCKDVKEYLSKRLAWTKEDMENIQRVYPFLFKVSILKLSKMLDFLLNEAAYTADEITKQIPIFSRSLSEINCRFNEYKSLNHRPTMTGLRCTPETYLGRIKKLCQTQKDGMAVFKLIESRLHERKTSSKNKN